MGHVDINRRPIMTGENHAIALPKAETALLQKRPNTQRTRFGDARKDVLGAQNPDPRPTGLLDLQTMGDLPTKYPRSPSDADYRHIGQFLGQSIDRTATIRRDFLALGAREKRILLLELTKSWCSPHTRG